jgi:hypothetical protein
MPTAAMVVTISNPAGISKEHSMSNVISVDQDNDREAFATAGLSCPSKCTDGWRFYEEVTASSYVNVDEGGGILVNIGDISFDSTYDPRFECNGCHFVVAGNEIDYIEW